MIEEKKGEWTVTKLLIIIMALVVMALVIYGLTHGGFGPLIDRVEATFNGVLIMLGIKEPTLGFDCQERFLASLIGEDSEFIKDINADVNTAKFKVCGNVCEINTGRGGEVYRLIGSSGSFEKWTGSKWVSYDNYLKGKLDDNKNLNEIYNDLFLSISLGDKEKIIKFYHDRITQRFILFGKDGGLFSSRSEDIWAIWENGNWSLFIRGVPKFFEYRYITQRYSGGVLDYGPDYDKMIEIFKKRVWQDAGDDEVHYKTAPPRILDDSYSEDDRDAGWNEENNIGRLIGGNDQLDDNPEFDALRIKVREIQQNLLKAREYTNEELEELKKAVADAGLELDENAEYLPPRYSPPFYDKLEISNIPIIYRTFDDGSKYGLKFYPKASPVLPNTYPSKTSLLYLPLELVKFENNKWVGVGDERDYRLKWDDWEKFLKARQIKDFLGDVCGP